MTAISIVGMGAFGRFMVPHLSPYGDLKLYDPYQDLSEYVDNHTVCDNFENIAQADYILLAVPVKAMESVYHGLKPYLKSGTTIVELASVKIVPLSIVEKALDGCDVDILGVHALFGPQSGKNGIAGLNCVVTKGSAAQEDAVARFLGDELKLNVTRCTAEEHDEQMAYVQGLTHLLAKTFNKMDIPDIFLPTKTYELLDQMWRTIRHDSDELFDLIQSQNPYTAEVRKKFISLTQDIDKRFEDK